MRSGRVASALVITVVIAVLAGCSGSNASDGCQRTDDVEEALSSLDHVAEGETDMNNVDERLEQLGSDVNEVMNTTDDPTALQISELELSYEGLRQSIEDLGNADDLSETGEELDDALSQIGDAIHRMSDATEENCTP